jgi:hypothetical protein
VVGNKEITIHVGKIMKTYSDLACMMRSAFKKAVTLDDRTLVCTLTNVIMKILFLGFLMGFCFGVLCLGILR